MLTRERTVAEAELALGTGGRGPAVGVPWSSVTISSEVPPESLIQQEDSRRPRVRAGMLEAPGIPVVSLLADMVAFSQFCRDFSGELQKLGHSYQVNRCCRCPTAWRSAPSGKAACSGLAGWTDDSSH